ncbi:hypothetical protein [Paracoccus aminophilus]|uniref:hypothetical protein n=1 Tax=Paracoccus aminophilus TaxID=34003 RepID=UPI0011DE52E1|nr:hypothetical protein [Paracoccus aminophilus]
MTGKAKTIIAIGGSGTDYIRGLLGVNKWGGEIKYAFPENGAAYRDGGPYPRGKAANGTTLPDETSSFKPVNDTIKIATKFALEGTNQGNAGFSIEGLTNASISVGSEKKRKY